MLSNENFTGACAESPGKRSGLHIFAHYQRYAYQKKSIKKAIKEAYSVQNKFYRSVKKRGKEILGSLKDDEILIVVSSRSYNSCDRAISMDVPKKLRELGL